MPKLTKRLVDATPFPSKGQVFVRDATLAGFALRVTPQVKAFVLEKRMRGRVRRLTLGPYGVLTVEQARATAVRLSADILDGKDPAQSRRHRHDEPTLAHLLELYDERYLPRKQPTSQRHDRSLIALYLSKWRSRKLSSISRSDVARLHAEIGRTAPYQANRCLALLRRLYNLAALLGLHPGTNPAMGVEAFKERQRDRFVQPDELPRLFDALAAEPNAYARVAFLTTLLSGARREEVLTMQWSHLNLSRREWTIPLTKAGRPHLVPLPAALCELLAQLPAMPGNPYVFVGRGPKGHLVNVKRAWHRIRTCAKLEDVRIHDLRRTLGSWLAGSGASLPLIGKVLNHSQPTTTAIYARLDLATMRKALEDNTERMLRTLGTLPPPIEE